MIEAVRQGNANFIKRLANANPHLVWDNTDVLRSMLEHRQPEVFSLVYGLRNMVELVSYRDSKHKSSMLHKVAIIAPPRVLNLIPGAALQMQRELQWNDKT